MSVADRLLGWVSERESGTFSAFRAAHGWLVQDDASPPPWGRVLGNLQALDHLEVDWPGQGWRALPPRLAYLADSGGHALLTGGRPRWLLDRLDRLDRDPDSRLQLVASDLLLCPPVPQADAPAARYLAVGSGDALARLAHLLHLDWQPDVATVLAEKMPLLNALLLPGERDEPVALPAQRMSGLAGGPLFVPTEPSGDPGAYAYPGYGRDRFFFRVARSYEAEKAVVVYAELRRQNRNVLHHDPVRRELLVPARMRLPSPYARAAVARTGLLPDYQPTVEVGGRRLGSVLRYQSVTSELAGKLGHCLGQQVQVLV